MTPAERRVLVVISAAHALNHAFIKLFPSLLDPIGAETGGDVAALGRVASAQNLAYGLPALLAGWCAGRIGSGRMVRGYLLLASVACGLVILPRGLAGTAGVLFFLGLACSLYHPAGLSMASRMSRPGTAMAVHGIFGNLGHSLAPLTAAAFVGLSALSWRLPYLVLGGAGLLLLLASARWIPTDGKGPADAPSPMDGSRTRPAPLFGLIALNFLTAVSYYAYDTFITKHLGSVLGATSPEEAARWGGIATAVAFAAGVGGQIAGGYLAHRFPLDRLFVISLFAGAPFLLLLAPAPGLLAVSAASGYAFVYFLNQPVGNLLIARFTSDRQRSVGYGLQFLATFGAGGMTASFSGEIAKRLGMPAMFLVAGCLLVTTAILAAVFFRAEDPRDPVAG